MYLRERTVALGIPLLRVQTDDDSLTQEQGRPHDDVPDRTLPLVVQDEVEHHCDRGEVGGQSRGRRKQNYNNNRNQW